MLLERRERMIYSSHHMFYVEDPDLLTDSSSPDFWNKKAFKDRLGVGPGLLGIRAGSYGNVRLISESHDRPPDVDVELWDHIAEAGLDISRDRFQIMGCLDDGNEELLRWLQVIIGCAVVMPT